MTDAWSGFIVTPSEIAARLQAIDRAVGNLDQQISTSNAPRVDERFKQAWRGFTQRWQITRDTYQAGDWTTRSAASRIMPRLDDFETALGRWLADFQARVSGTAAPPPVTLKPQAPEPSSTDWLRMPLSTSGKRAGLSFAGVLGIAGLGALSAWLVLRRGGQPA